MFGTKPKAKTPPPTHVVTIDKTLSVDIALTPIETIRAGVAIDVVIMPITPSTTNNAPIIFGILDIHYHCCLNFAEYVFALGR